MNPLIAGALGSVLDTVIDKLTKQIPVSDTEREHIKLEAEKTLADKADVIAQAEAAVAETRTKEWLGDLATPHPMSALWRPMVALGSFFILLWDGILGNVINSILVNLGYLVIPSVPASTTEVVGWVLLTLVGARSIDKLVVTRKVK
jgi:hypothetical protein